MSSTPAWTTHSDTVVVMIWPVFCGAWDLRCAWAGCGQQPFFSKVISGCAGGLSEKLQKCPD